MRKVLIVYIFIAFDYCGMTIFYPSKLFSVSMHWLLLKIEVQTIFIIWCWPIIEVYESTFSLFWISYCNFKCYISYCRMQTLFHLNYVLIVQQKLNVKWFCWACNSTSTWILLLGACDFNNPEFLMHDYSHSFESYAYLIIKLQDDYRI